MDKERIRQAALGRRTSGDKALRRRLLVYCAITLAIGLTYFLGSGGQQPALPGEPLEALDVPDETRPPRPRIERGLLAAVRDGTRTERALLEPEATAHLLDGAGRLVWGDLEKLGLAKGAWDALAADGASRRGDAFWVIGTLRWVEQDTLDRRTVWRGEILDEQQQPWCFLVLTEPWEIEVGGVVKIAGFYLKNWDVLRPDGSWAGAPLLIGEELLRSAFHIEPVTALREGLLDDVRDHDLAEASRPLETPEFYELLSFVSHAAEEDVFPPGAPLPEVRPDQLLLNPDGWRARALLATGVVLYMRQVPLGERGENPLGVPLVWQLWVTDQRAAKNSTMLVWCLEKPDVAERDIVDVRGVFFRRLAFENQRQEARLAPVILARDVRRFVPLEGGITTTIEQIILWGVGALAALLFLGQWREKRMARVARGEQLGRRRRLRGPERGGETVSPGEAGSSPGEAAAAELGSSPGSSSGGSR